MLSVCRLMLVVLVASVGHSVVTLIAASDIKQRNVQITRS
jgi:hypothetical protein